MADEKLLAKVANVPIAKPGYDTLGMSAPIIVQMNNKGRWENTKPEYLDEEKLKGVVQHIANSKALSAAKSYCCQCAAENRQAGGKQQYIPIVMMPIYAADQCPFDMDCEVEKMKGSENKGKPQTKRNLANAAAAVKEEDKEKDKRKTKKRGYVLQRLTDFDLLSQW
ncbi:unnamed protein product [Chrysodeixis includens]|uniref:Uncharacterized protein n=1 Tax=Chrysodeixis includens TaxID=689277 RepID=A0A9P0BP74_CHRIL|nr:unnamed protein product [Chrysodeixis includens]